MTITFDLFILAPDQNQQSQATSGAESQYSRARVSRPFHSSLHPFGIPIPSGDGWAKNGGQRSGRSEKIVDRNVCVENAKAACCQLGAGSQLSVGRPIKVRFSWVLIKQSESGHSK